METAPEIFDRNALRVHRDRAAQTFCEYDFLVREIGARLSDRLLDMARKFPLALDLGARTGGYGPVPGGPGGIEHVVSCELSERMARQIENSGVVCDPEILPFAESRFDLVYSNLELHWANDLPGCLLQITRSLKPDGLFLAAILGGNTLTELRDVLMAAELDVTGGASPRVSPFAELRDAGALLQRAGLALPVVDADEITVTYENLFRLLADLRGMGETNTVRERLRTSTRRNIFLRAAELYLERYPAEDGRIRATFEIIFLHGWAPHASQQRALRPGSAKTSLADALGTAEYSAGDSAGPDRSDVD
ncbi:MAG: methyltransferase domain-containing protein [Pseudomonadota bacterium]|nr:methyltransferase domain-containing protein [Pseudomonadota bacterium]